MNFRLAIAIVIGGIIGIWLNGYWPFNQSELEVQENRLVKFINNNRFGNSRDVWMIHHGISGPAKVGLIFGMGDDYKLCKSIIDAYNESDAENKLSCERNLLQK